MNNIVRIVGVIILTITALVLADVNSAPKKLAYSKHQPANNIIACNTQKGKAMPLVDPIYLSTTLVRRFSGNESKGTATGFFFQSQQGPVYLVTNKHVIYGDNFSDENATPEIDEIKLTLHINKNNLSQNEEVTISLFNKNDKLWKEHSMKNIDIVCTPLDLDRDKFIFATVDKSLLDISNIKIGMEKIFVMGYPYGWYDSLHNLPITRIGHLSSPFGVPFHGNPFMLGDVETHPGMSGSPAFMHLVDYITVDNDKSTRHLGQSKIILLGVFSGQPKWEIKDKKTGTLIEIPHSLSVIWFGDLIKEIIGE
jgi:hypothetical protein